ncbi:DNA-binding protein Roi [Klebsiella pneumoniae]
MMNNLITNKPSMTSLEIAELVEKRHDNVKRTIETLIMRGVITSPQIEEKPTAGRPQQFTFLKVKKGSVTASLWSRNSAPSLPPGW